MKFRPRKPRLSYSVRGNYWVCFLVIDGEGFIGIGSTITDAWASFTEELGKHG